MSSAERRFTSRTWTARAALRASLLLVILLSLMVWAAPRFCLAQSAGPATTRASATDAEGFELPKGAYMRLGSLRLNDGMGSTFESLSPDSTHVISVARSEGVRVWDMATGVRVAELNDGGRSVGLATYAGRDHVAVVWNPTDFVLHNAATGRIVQKFDVGPDRAIVSLFASRDGSRLVAVSQMALKTAADAERKEVENTPPDAVLYNATDGSRVADLGPCNVTNSRSGVEFSADSKRLVTLAPGGRVKLWNASDGSAIDASKIPLTSGVAVSLSPDGGRVAIVNGEILVVDTATGEIVKKFAVFDAGFERVSQIQFSPTGAMLAAFNVRASARDGNATKMMVFDCEGKRAPLSMVIDGNFIGWTSDGSLIAAAENVPMQVPKLHLVDPVGGNTLTPQGPVIGPVAHASISPDDRQLIISDANANLYLLDISDGRVRARRPAESSRITQLDYSEDGKLIRLAAWFGGFYTYDATTLRLIDNRPSPNQQEVQDASFDSTFTIVAETLRSGARIRNLKTGEEIHSFEGGRNGLTRLALSPADPRQVAVMDNTSIRLVDLKSGAERPLSGNISNDTVIGGWSSDGSLMSLNSRSQVQLIEVASGQVKWRAESQNPFRTEFTPSNSFVAIAGNDCIALIEAYTGRTIGRIDNTSLEKTRSLVLEHDTSRLIKCTTVGTLLFYDLREVLHDDSLAGAQANELWGKLTGEDAAIAYAAGIALGQRPLEFAALIAQPPRMNFSPLAAKEENAHDASAGPETTAPLSEDPLHWERLVAKLASTDAAVREQAHRELEAGGAAAAPAVARALRNRPVGEQAERLRSIARLIGADPNAAPPTNEASRGVAGPVAQRPPQNGGRPAPRVPQQTAAAIALPITGDALLRRLVQMIEWMPDQDAAAKILAQMNEREKSPIVSAAIDRAHARQQRQAPQPR